ncbi:SGNH/GDSL hydrolase family protein, partial [Candidatus Binatia bacterium]|nr:SGNH/GDSL hydrolase family protein [Candidatus Binatia bacterium]
MRRPADPSPAPSRVAHLVRATLIGTAALVFGVATLLALAELGVRALYWYAFASTAQAPLVYERVSWAVPPWVANTSVLYGDPELGLWMRPNARRTYVNLFGPIGSLDEVGTLFDSLFPELPDWAERRPRWHLNTNAAGLRGDELPSSKASDTFRIVVLGDSWTVGINVEQELTFPAQLRDMLADGVAHGRVEVLNFGAIGTGAETGVRLLPRVLALAPDLVVVAYAQNDESEARDARPKPARPIGALPKAETGFASVLHESELYKLIQWWQTPRDDRIAATLHRELTRPSLPPSNSPGRPCINPNAASSRYAAALERIVQEVEDAGIPVVLLYDSVPEFFSHCTLAVLQAIGAARGLPLVDASVVLEDLGNELLAERARRLGLAPAGIAPDRRVKRGIDAVFRVDMSSAPPGSPPSVMGNAPQLGGFTPNAVPLFDDGTRGDEVAGDGVWSRQVHFDQPQILTYSFTNGSEAGRWTGLENYRLRSWALRDTDVKHTVLLPVEEFGVHVLRSDSSHPDAAGDRAIAEALAATVRATPQ